MIDVFYEKYSKTVGIEKVSNMADAKKIDSGHFAML